MEVGGLSNTVRGNVLYECVWMNTSFLRSLAVIVLLVPVFGTAGQAAGALILPQLTSERAASIASMSGESRNTGVPLDCPVQVRKIAQRLGVQPAFGSFTSSSCSTTYTGHGSAALESFVCLSAPTLVARLAGELKLIYYNPPPTSLLKPPRVAA